MFLEFFCSTIPALSTANYLGLVCTANQKLWDTNSLGVSSRHPHLWWYHKKRSFLLIFLKGHANDWVYICHIIWIIQIFKSRDCGGWCHTPCKEKPKLGTELENLELWGNTQQHPINLWASCRGLYPPDFLDLNQETSYMPWELSEQISIRTFAKRFICGVKPMILNTSCILYVVKLDVKSPRNKLQHNTTALYTPQAISNKNSQ